MTRTTVAGYTGMTECSGDKAGGLVADTAVFICRHVRWVGRLAYGNNTIVTISTVIDDAGMIELGAGKGGGVMTYGAILGRYQMGRPLDETARRVRSVMT